MNKYEPAGVEEKCRELLRRACNDGLVRPEKSPDVMSESDLAGIADLLREHLLDEAKRASLECIAIMTAEIGPIEIGPQPRYISAEE